MNQGITKRPLFPLYWKRCRCRKFIVPFMCQYKAITSLRQWIEHETTLGIYAYDHHSLLFFAFRPFMILIICYFIYAPHFLISLKPIKLWYNNNPQALLPMLKGEYKMCFKAEMAESEKGIWRHKRTKGYTHI